MLECIVTWVASIAVTQGTHTTVLLSGLRASSITLLGRTGQNTSKWIIVKISLLKKTNKIVLP